MLIEVVSGALLLALVYLAVRVAVLSGVAGTGMVKERYLLVVAHPDDECMFFGPFLSKATEHRKSVKIGEVEPVVVVMCTSGGRGGDRCVRKREAKKAVEEIGAAVVFLEEEDGELDAKKSTVEKIKKIHRETGRTRIVTFDAGGVSGHPDHKACFEISRKVCREVGDGYLYALSSISLVEKYWVGPLGAKGEVVLKNSIRQSVACRRQMGQYKSQLLWFRYAYIAFSTYMDVNVFRKVMG